MKFFQKVKEIRSKTGELHFQRWAVFETSLVSLYIHKILKEDKDLHQHNHPWNFVSIILKGCYLVSELFAEDYSHLYLRHKSFGSVTKMTYDDFHKIVKIEKGPVWSLLLAYGKRKSWGYLVNGGIVESGSLVNGGSRIVDSAEYRKQKNINVQNS